MGLHIVLLLLIVVNICTKFEQKDILSQEPEDLKRRLVNQNNWGGLTMSMAPSLITNLYAIILIW